MCFLELEDYNSKAEIVVFPKLYQKVEPWLNKYPVFIVKGITDATGKTKAKLKAQQLIPMDLIFEYWACKKACIELPENITEDLLTKIKEKTIPGSTTYEFLFKEQDKKLKLKPRGKIRLTLEFFEILEKNKANIKLEY